METTFGKNLISLRKKKNISQRKLAELIGVNHSTIVNYEKNGSYPTKGDTRKNLLEVLDCTENELFGYIDGAANKDSYITYSLMDLRNDTTLDDDYSVKVFDSESLYPVDPYYKRKYPNGVVFKRYYNMCDNVIQKKATLFAAPCNVIQMYDNQICAVIKDNAVYVYRVKVIDDEVIVLITDNKEKYERQMVSISDLEIVGKVVWYCVDLEA